MRIVTLGHTAVGKTTYMASLYGALQRSYEGFTLRAKRAADHKHLKVPCRVDQARDIPASDSAVQPVRVCSAFQRRGGHPVRLG